MRDTAGSNGLVPEEVRVGFNWGAFWLSWVWGLSNGVYVSLLVLILPIVWQVYLGVKGNELAWRHRRFTDVEHFYAVQRTWAKWGWVVAIITVVAGVVSAVLAGGLAVLGMAVWESAGH